MGRVLSAGSDAGWPAQVDPADGRASAGREHAGPAAVREPVPVGSAAGRAADRRAAHRSCQARGVGDRRRVVPKCGKASVGVAHQYCGAVGKRANCQVAVSVHAATDTASCPSEWQLYLPREWTDEPDRCRRAGVPDDVAHREKWRPALGLLDTLADWQSPTRRMSNRTSLLTAGSDRPPFPATAPHREPSASSQRRRVRSASPR